MFFDVLMMRRERRRAFSLGSKARSSLFVALRQVLVLHLPVHESEILQVLHLRTCLPTSRPSYVTPATRCSFPLSKSRAINVAIHQNTHNVIGKSGDVR